MNCPKCNQPVEPSATFCGNCGQALRAATPQPALGSSAIQTAAVAAPGMAPGTPVVQPNFAAAPGVGSTGQPADAGIPQYAAPLLAVKGSGMLTAGLILTIVAIPGALIPIVGLVLAITGIVLGNKHRHAGIGRATAATVVGSIAIVLSLVAWGYNIHTRLQSQQTGMLPASASSAATPVRHATDSSLAFFRYAK